MWTTLMDPMHLPSPHARHMAGTQRTARSVSLTSLAQVHVAWALGTTASTQLGCGALDPPPPQQRGTTLPSLSCATELRHMHAGSDVHDQTSVCDAKRLPQRAQQAQISLHCHGRSASTCQASATALADALDK